MKDMLTWFGLKRYPFDKDIDTKDAFPSRAFKECLARLEYMKRRGGMMLMIGDPGVGKTIATRHFRSLLNESLYRPMYTPLTTLKRLDLLRHINDMLGLPRRPSKSALFAQIQQEIIETREHRGRTVVIIIDEAQLLHPSLLQELRLLTNFKMDSYDPFILILSGQTDFERVMAFSIMEPFAQRLNLRYKMPPLGRDEIAPYIEHHMTLAGAHEPVFGKDAVEAIYEITAGLPRRVGKLCELALVAATLDGKKSVDADTIISVKAGG